VPTSGGTPIELYPPHGVGDEISLYGINQTNDGVVFSTSENYLFDALYCVSINGKERITLDSSCFNKGENWETYLTPDGNSIVAVSNEAGIYSIPCNGDAAIELVSASECYFVAFNSDASKIIYRVKPDGAHFGKLNIVPVSGGESIQLTDYLPGESLKQEKISPDLRRYVYMAQINPAYGPVSLYSVSLEDGSVVMLNAPLVENGDVHDFNISSDSKRVVYRADQDTDGFDELFSVPISGGVRVKLYTRVQGMGNVSSFAVSSDGSFVVYMAYSHYDDDNYIYRVPIDGGDSVIISPQLKEYEHIIWFEMSQKSDILAYTLYDDTTYAKNLYGIPISGGTPVKLTQFEVMPSWVTQFGFTPNGDRIVYLAEHYPYCKEMYSVSSIGGRPVKLFSLVGYWLWINLPTRFTDGNRAIFSAQVTQDGWPDLYSVPLSPINLQQLLLLLD